MRSKKCPKILASRRRGGLFKHQNNSSDLERHHLVCGAKVGIAPFFLVPQPLLLNARRRVARFNVSDKSKTPRRGVSSAEDSSDVTVFSRAYTLVDHWKVFSNVSSASNFAPNRGRNNLRHEASNFSGPATYLNSLPSLKAIGQSFAPRSCEPTSP